MPVAGGFVASMPRELTSFGGTVVDGAFYLVGGYGGQPHRYTAEGQSSDVWRLSLGGDARWTHEGSLPYGLQGLAIVGHRGEVCRFGGSRVEAATGAGSAVMRSVADAACWSTRTHSWRALPDLPAARSSHDAVLVGDTVFLAGGWTLDGTGATERDGTWSGDVLRLDLSSKDARWTSLPTPARTRAATVVAARGKLYVMGGLGSDKQPSRSVHVLDLGSSTWSRGPDLPTDGFGMAAIADDASGAVVASTPDGSVLRLRGAAWERVGSLTFPRFFHRLAWRKPGELVAIGGITGMQTHGRTKLVETFSLEPSASEVSRVELPFPGRAKNRQAFFVRDDFLYVFGGNDSTEQHDFEPKNFVSEGHRLHLPSLTWSTVAAYPHARQSMSTAWVGDQLLALGGFGHDGSGAVSFTEGYWCSSKAEAWTPAPSLPKGRTQFGLTTHGAEIFVFGGLNYDPSRKKAAFDHVTTTLVASSGGSFVDAGAPLPSPRRAFGGATLGDEYFLVGGMRDDFHLVEDCLRYSFVTKEYRAMPCPSKTRLSAKLVVIGETIYAVGGSTRAASGNLEPERSIEAFDPRTSTWSTVVEDVGFDTHHVNVATYRDRIVLSSTQSPRSVMTLAFVRPRPSAPSR